MGYGLWAIGYWLLAIGYWLSTPEGYMASCLYVFPQPWFHHRSPLGYACGPL
jgi:hypothetical protein